MQSEKELYQSLEKELQLDTYKSIEDLVVYIWWKIHSTGDTTRLIKGDFEASDDTTIYCNLLWDKIKDEHIDQFGLPHEYISYLKQLKKVGIQRAKYAMSQNGIDNTWVQIEERELEDMKGVAPTNEYRTKAILEERRGYRIDPHSTTVMEYSTYIKLEQERQAHGRPN